jgi:hypothetical protein
VLRACIPALRLQNKEIFMMEGVSACILLFFCALFGLMFQLQRRLYRQRLRARLEPGFYPSSRDLGNALHTLQVFAQPRVAYVQEAKLKDLADDDANGDGSPEGAAS